MAWTVDWRVTIDGNDVSNNMRAYLMDITVSDKDGAASDTCSLKFDDTGGQLLLPEPGAAVVVYLDGAQVFEGVVDSTPWELTRGGGRTLGVNAKGDDHRGKTKERQAWHMDEATLKDVMETAAKKAGLQGVVMDPELGAIKRDYWALDNVSFNHFGADMAARFGATFKIRGKRAVFVKRGAGTTGTGDAMPTITASIPGNVISVSVDPAQGKRRYKKSTVRYFDRDSATFKSESVDIDLDDVDVTNTSRELAANADDAKRHAAGRKSDSERDSGTGSVEMDLSPEAQAEGTLVLTGARPGIDGTYRIVSVTHKASRSSGATTTLEIKQPQGDAGKTAEPPPTCRCLRPRRANKAVPEARLLGR
ncbi:hypothetical protein ASG43_08875 [Aureimonas sp. Leaf454]|uniref:phage late control D family protein n=1 Tax=Aureimonas sp. Leaf454 TaxID=1736381 RepID=UPI0006FD65B9|nr:hypothetical protein [Aureimonas sp. Leaf454]KQT48936.1 hypothetical protein ASG43_08875 [Aureimonas sp. Leaf454]